MAKPTSSPFRTLRLTRIPMGTTREKLRDDLRAVADSTTSLGKTLQTVSVRSLCRRTSRTCTATVVVKLESDLSNFIDDFNVFFEELEVDYRLDNSFEGLTPLYDDGNEVVCDIVAVPGLNSHALGAWKTPGRNDVWIRDWLPKSVRGLRVLLYGYDSRLQNGRDLSSIEDLGESLLDALTSYREDDKTSTRPVILLGHSLGGLLLKEALVRSGQSPRLDEQSLHLSCCGMVFFGVPHWGARFESLQAIMGNRPNKALIDAIVVDSEAQTTPYLDRLSTEFAKYYTGEKRIVLIYEKCLTDTVVEINGKLEKTGEPKLLVTKASATRVGTTGIKDEDMKAFRTDHSKLNKFSSDEDHSYEIVRDRIRNMVHSAVLLPAQYLQSTESGRPSAYKHQGSTISQTGPSFSGDTTLADWGSASQGNDLRNSLNLGAGVASGHFESPIYANKISAEDIEADDSNFDIGNSYFNKGTQPDSRDTSSTSAKNVRAKNGSSIRIGHNYNSNA